MGRPPRILKRLPRLRVIITAAAVLTFAALAASRGPALEDSPTPAQAAPPMAFTFGQENSWIRVQNMGAVSANVVVSYFDAGGRRIAQDSCPSPVCPNLGPGQGWTFFQNGNPALPVGYQGSALVESDQPIIALQAKDVLRGGAFMIDGSTTTVAAGSYRMYLPLLANRDGAQQDSQGRFAVQNLSDRDIACVTITYLSNYTDGEVHWDPYKPDARSPRREPGCPKGGRPIPPRGTLFRDPDTFGVPPGFTGSVRIDTHENANRVRPDQQVLTATADYWNTHHDLFSSYRALDQGDMSTTVLLPLVDREVGPGNGYSTRFQIENKDPARTAQVTIRFEGFDLNTGGFVAKQNTVTVKGARLCFQDRNDFANCLAPGDALPRNFVGTARLTSTQPIGVIVTRSTYFGEQFTNYRAFTPNDGARRVLLPVLNKSYGPFQGRRGWDSWFRVLVADGGQANVTIRYYGLDLPGGTQAYSRTAFREFTVFQYEEPFLPNGFAGTAVIESDRPIVVLANIYTDVFAGDTDLLYNGIPLP
jgi:hypothetical protein